MFKNLSSYQKGSLLAFIGVMFITPDTLFIRLSNVDTWSLLFYRGLIPFVIVLLGLIFFYKGHFLKALFKIGYAGIFYIISFSICNITFIISVQNTNVANTLIMVAMAPMLSAILSSIFLKEPTNRETWIAIFITFFSVTFIFYDSIQLGNIVGDIFGFITALGLAINANIARYAKDKDLVPSAVIGKFVVAFFAYFFVDDFKLIGFDQIIVPIMCVMCVAIPFVLVTIAPRYIPAPEVNLFFLLEVILGPIWVWLVIKEEPSSQTIIGGLIILFTIAIHSFLALKKTQIKST
ncbi:MAG: DMT family transporter [Rickettsiales bacterium TMED289]|nr:MAG: DMT family transporter [Rickettsiales bacterium TMED289]|tara:strand:- start:454 stop:1332 length:879 start_codon:yes stop_codon:yes gene_type:complete